MGREGMPEGMTGGVLLDVGQSCRFLHCTLKSGFVEVVAMAASGFGILELPVRRKNPLLPPSAVSIRILQGKRFRQCNVAATILQILFELDADILGEMGQELFHLELSHFARIAKAMEF